MAQTAPTGAAATSGDDRMLLVWAIVCFGIAIVLVVLEAFLPSGGVLGGIAGLAAVVGIALFFGFDTRWGVVSMAITFLALPFILSGMLWVWPNTPIGRALTLKEEPRPGADQPPAPPPFPIGTRGTAATDLRPIGSCKFDGKRTECLAVGGMIEAGTPVKVIDVEGTTIRVRAELPLESDQEKPTA